MPKTLNSVASAFPVACCGVSERILNDIAPLSYVAFIETATTNELICPEQYLILQTLLS
jgi:hypothetical protein